MSALPPSLSVAELRKHFNLEDLAGELGTAGERRAPSRQPPPPKKQTEASVAAAQGQQRVSRQALHNYFAEQSDLHKFIMAHVASAEQQQPRREVQEEDDMLDAQFSLSELEQIPYAEHNWGQSVLGIIAARPRPHAATGVSASSKPKKGHAALSLSQDLETTTSKGKKHAAIVTPSISAPVVALASATLIPTEGKAEGGKPVEVKKSASWSLFGRKTRRASFSVHMSDTVNLGQASSGPSQRGSSVCISALAAAQAAPAAAAAATNEAHPNDSGQASAASSSFSLLPADSLLAPLPAASTLLESFSPAAEAHGTSPHPDSAERRRRISKLVEQMAQSLPSGVRDYSASFDLQQKYSLLEFLVGAPDSDANPRGTHTLTIGNDHSGETSTDADAAPTAPLSRNNTLLRSLFAALSDSSVVDEQAELVGQPHRASSSSGMARIVEAAEASSSRTVSQELSRPDSLLSAASTATHPAASTTASTTATTPAKQRWSDVSATSTESAAKDAAHRRWQHNQRESATSDDADQGCGGGSGGSGRDSPGMDKSSKQQQQQQQQALSRSTSASFARRKESIAKALDMSPHHHLKYLEPISAMAKTMSSAAGAAADRDGELALSKDSHHVAHHSHHSRRVNGQEPSSAHALTLPPPGLFRRTKYLTETKLEVMDGPQWLRRDGGTTVGERALDATAGTMAGTTDPERGAAGEVAPIAVEAGSISAGRPINNSSIATVWPASESLHAGSGEGSGVGGRTGSGEGSGVGGRTGSGEGQGTLSTEITERDAVPAATEGERDNSISSTAMRQGEGDETYNKERASGQRLSGSLGLLMDFLSSGQSLADMDLSLLSA